MDWTYVWITLALLGIMATYVAAYVFFRRMYYVIVEIEARLIQIRDMIESQAQKTKDKAARRSQRTHIGPISQSGQSGRSSTQQPPYTR